MYTNTDEVPSTQQQQRQYEHRLFLFLNAQHMHILISRAVLLSASSIDENFEEALGLTISARRMIMELCNFDKRSGIYRNRPKHYNTVLISALATLFLSICHKPDEFLELCRNEFHAAIDLLKRNNASTSVSMRTRNLIQAVQRAISVVYSSQQQPRTSDFLATPLSDPIEVISNPNPHLSIPTIDQFTAQGPDTALFSGNDVSANDFDFMQFLEMWKTLTRPLAPMEGMPIL